MNGVNGVASLKATDADLINATQIRAWAEQTAAPFIAAGYTNPGQVSMVAQADEPSWSWDAAVPPVHTSPLVRAMWEQYLKMQGLVPADLGQSTWDAVYPIGRHDARFQTECPTRWVLFWIHDIPGLKPARG
jgi:hypothetical protein